MAALLVTGITASTISSRDDESRVTSHESRTGVLVVAHGGSNRWNDMVRDAVRHAKLSDPVEVVFGMGMHPHEVRQLQQAIDRLQRKGVRRIVVIPLLVSSHSEVFRQFEFLFGLRPEPTWPEAGLPVTHQVPIEMRRALDDDPIVAEILLERARALSRRPAEETVILLAHGPVSEPDNQQWLAAMRQVADSVEQEGGFHEVMGLTIRDDAPKPIRDDAVAALRQAVQQAGEGGRVLVVPLLIAEGGIERKIPKLLAGLSYVFNGQTLLPHPRLSQWLTQEAARLARELPQAHSELVSAVVQ